LILSFNPFFCRPRDFLMSKHYTITELAREFDVTPRAIRFYEDQGLLSPSREGSGGLRRVYSGRDRTRLRLTLRGKRLGFTLSEIRDLLDLYESPTDTTPQLQAFLSTVVRHREVLERQREDLIATLEDLAQYEAQARALLAAGGREGARAATSREDKRSAGGGENDNAAGEHESEHAPEPGHARAP
jgi:DNA-binding transcriptional MerR regulator